MRLNIVSSSNLQFHQDPPDSRALQHEAFILKELDDMHPYVFRTDLCDSLTAFYENICKKSRAGGRQKAPEFQHR